MPNIRKSININPEELSGYDGLIGALLNYAVKDLQSSYKKLYKEKNKDNYFKFKAQCLFFERNCNGYIDPELSRYIYEKALRIIDNEYKNKEVEEVKNYIKLMEQS